jgi:hypothetical protein
LYSANISHLVTTTPVVLGGNADISLTYSIYLLASPVNSGSYSPYMSGYGGESYSDSDPNNVSKGNYTQYFGRNPGTTSATILDTTEAKQRGRTLADPVWLPYSGTANLFPLPAPGTFEIWCFCKESGYPGSETYRNNKTENVPAEQQRVIHTPSAGYVKSSTWRVGAGSNNWKNGSCYIGAFIVYDVYHDSAARARVHSQLESEFGVVAS